MTRKPSTTLVAVLALSALLTAQTKITPPSNKYKPSEDVQLGREAAAQARKQLPMLREERVSSYVSGLGRKLADVIPAEFAQSEFKYTFDVVNVRDLNAFALPGGPMFLNRGMIEAARNEGEVVGVMAHELSHVVLRHGTAQASRATKFQIGEIIGAVAGAIVGGTTGSIIQQGTSFGLGTYFLKYGREYERQADLLGAQIMARAGYDPRDMASMFKTLEKQGSSGPEWLSDHPNPGNRADSITKEAQTLQVQNPVRTSREFEQVVARLRDLPKAPTSEEVARNSKRGGTTSSRSDTVPTGRVSAPSSQFRTYNEGDVFRISVPANWQELPDSTSVTFAPENAYGTFDGQSVFTHGVQVGLSRTEAPLDQATDELINHLRRGNPRMGQPSSYRSLTLGGRRGLQTTLSNMSDATNTRERILLATTLLENGDLLYAVFVAPDREFSAYQPVFQRVANSIAFM